MDIRPQGISLQEGSERLLSAGLSEQILEQGRVQLVERELLDKLLEELRLGASHLADRSTALHLGRILAAKLMLSGQVIHAGPQTQVSLRLIETETGHISAAVNQSFGSAVPASEIAEKMSRELLEKIEKLYPLRGSISEVKENQVTLNLGRKQGVRTGQQFKVKDLDAVLEIVEVGEAESKARAVKGAESIAAGLRVEIL